jgi:hypothetical protein
MNEPDARHRVRSGASASWAAAAEASVSPPLDQYMLVTDYLSEQQQQQRSSMLLSIMTWRGAYLLTPALCETDNDSCHEAETRQGAAQAQLTSAQPHKLIDDLFVTEHNNVEGRRII